MTNFLSPSDAETLEIKDYLTEKLQIPKHVRSFSVHFAYDECVTVTCDYYPENLHNGS